MATLFAQERGLQAQKHLQKTANIAVGREKTCIFFVVVSPFEATSEYTGCIPWNSYVSDSCDSFAWFLPCWGRGLQGCWKRGVILDFAVQMAAAGHILACRWSQNAPTKLSIYFGLSLLLPWVLSWNRAGGGIAWFVNESETRGVTVGRRGLWHPL